MLTTQGWRNMIFYQTLRIYFVQTIEKKETQMVENKMTLSLNQCENGVYLVQVESNHAKVVRRIIKN